MKEKKFCVIKMFFVFFQDKREGDDYGCRAGVCDPAGYHGQAAFWPSCQDHWTQGSLVLWSSVHGC